MLPRLFYIGWTSFEWILTIVFCMGCYPVGSVSPRQLEAASVGAFVYAALLLSGGTGLLLRKRWAEYFTIITTAGLIPLEI